MLSSLTSLSLPQVRLAALGLLGAVIGFSAPARESGTSGEAGESALATGSVSREAPLNAFYMGPGVSESAARATQISALGPPPPSFHRNEDGTTTVTIRWDFNDGKNSERRSTQLVLTTLPAPEPTPAFLGACAGCVVLLHRRRAQPSKHRLARVKLSAAFCASRRAGRLAPGATARSARAPREPREQLRCRPSSGRDAYRNRLFPRTT